MAAQDERLDGYYRGTVALNTPVPNRSRELVLVALDVWDHGVDLRGAATIDRADPFWLPSSWRITTDAGTVHTRGGGGGGSMRWLVHFEPSIPSTAQEVRVYVGPDGERPPSEDSLPAEPSVVTALTGWPVVLQRAATTVDRSARLTPPSSRTPTFEGRRVRPDRVIPVSTQLDDVTGRDLNVLSIESYPTWFFLHLGGSGGLSGLYTGETMRHLRRRWTAEDDRGGQYEGTVGGGHSGWPWTIDAPFTPALDPAATSLALTFPSPFGPGVVGTTISLPAD